jgi:hypothetical protein
MPDDKPAVVILQRPQLIGGLVAIFDVLGFKSFCQNNNDETVAFEVLTTIDMVPEGMTGMLTSALGNNSAAGEVASRLKWLVFSDTILVSLPNAESEADEIVSVFFAACSVFNRLMFDRGLPVRGAIEAGSFLLGNRCAAGRVIVEVLETIESLEAACTVASDRAWAIIYERSKKNKTFEEFLLPMLSRRMVACKDGKREMPLLNWFAVRIGEGSNPSDLEAYVKNAFLAHGKQLNKSGIQKMENTFALFNECKESMVSASNSQK